MIEATTWFYFDPLSFTMIPLAFCRGQTGESKGDTPSSFKSLTVMLVSAVPLVIKHHSFKDLPLPLSIGQGTNLDCTKVMGNNCTYGLWTHGATRRWMWARIPFICLAYINLSLMEDHNGTSDALLSESAQPWCPGALEWSGHSFPSTY